MKRVDIGSAQLEYIENGSGEPVVLVHGSASDLRTWQALPERFGETFRALAYSRRYHWPNPEIPDDADYSMAEQVDDLARFATSIGAVPAHLVGHSYGGFVCLLLAIRKPDLVRSLVLIEPPVVTLFLSQPPRLSELLSLFLRRPRTAAAILRLGARGLGPATAAARRGDMEAAMRTFGRAVLGPEVYDRLPEEQLEQIRTNSFRAEFVGSGLPDLDADDVRNVDRPTLLIGGDRSPAVFPRLLDGLEELLPRTERVEISGASHIVQQDAPEAFTSVVLSFLERHRGGG